jgi:hypothetical protein
MRLLISIIIHCTIFALLTLFTQVGGIIYILWLLTKPYLLKKAKYGRLYRSAYFFVLYIIIVIWIVPPLARHYGRVPLPWTTTEHVQPLNVLTCVLNRHYVKPVLREALFDVAKRLHAKYPDAKTNYLEANFPFIDGFPLWPHLSHNDGKKLDLSFCYRNSATNQLTNECPSWIGYGICEEPQSGEYNMADVCAKKGYWQYSALQRWLPQGNKSNYTLDVERTKDLIASFATQPDIGKILIEPHLKTRWNLTNEKIRFHGCQAVRHDDHIHVQLK